MMREDVLMNSKDGIVACYNDVGERDDDRNGRKKEKIDFLKKNLINGNMDCGSNRFAKLENDVAGARRRESGREKNIEKSKKKNEEVVEAKNRINFPCFVTRSEGSMEMSGKGKKLIFDVKNENYADRFIPMRLSQELIALQEFGMGGGDGSKKNEKIMNKGISKRKQYKLKLKSELLNLKQSKSMRKEKIFRYTSKRKTNQKVNFLKKISKEYFNNFKKKENKKKCGTSQIPFSEMLGYYDEPYSTYFGRETQAEPIGPVKTLEAPDLQEDFYLNLLDFSCNGLLAVSLKSNVFIWNSYTKDIQQVFKRQGPIDQISSVKFSKDGSLLVIGDSTGKVRFYDCSVSSKNFKGYGDYGGHATDYNLEMGTRDTKKLDLSEIRQIGEVQSHVSRIGVLDSAQIQGSSYLASGSRDSLVNVYDIRVSPVKNQSTIITLDGHAQEVCGLAFNNNYKLASGGNDNLLSIFDIRRPNTPEHSLYHHNAAIKGLSFDPFNPQRLYSGGGNRDKTVKIFNTNIGKVETVINVESQVTGIIFSERARNQFVTTHGFSKNNLLLWDTNMPNQPVCEFEGHDKRVLYSALGPSGLEIVTGAGDETLKFWEVFRDQRGKAGLASNQFAGGVMEIR